ncbi:MAG: formate--tetrahydrofolate ligase [Myxococcota bacterium]
MAPAVHNRPIRDHVEALGFAKEHVRFYGEDIVKISPEAMKAPRTRSTPSKLVLVSAITPTPAGEGKTTTSIGLAQGLHALGQSVSVALREPSLGPAFGIKGGATGGGKSQVVPADRINLHFTGDFHAITSAHNLLAALVDNHLHFGQSPAIDPRRVVWPRVLDMNDRSLRRVVVGLGNRSDGMPRQDGFEITAASEVMAALCLAESAADLRARLERCIVGYSPDGAPVTAKDLHAADAMVALLQDAVWPNLVQTTEGVPAFVHGGPFANIAHGCNSVIATRMALHASDWAITEAGFGFDLGGVKFFDIKARAADLDPAVVVLVATVRALKYHGGASLKDLKTPDPKAVAAGLQNLDRHIDSLATFGKEPVIAINRFADDNDEETAVIQAHGEKRGLPCALSEHFARGGEGAESLAKAVMAQAERGTKKHTPLYEVSQSVEAKIESVAAKMYGAEGVIFSKGARTNLKRIKKLGFDNLPVCIAKTHRSLSDDPTLRGRPTGFEITVREIVVNAAAGFLVVITGDIMRMPGLPKEPRARHIKLGDDGVEGLM